MKETIIQFGEGNFLRGFVDWFVQQMNEQRLYDGKIVIVQPLSEGGAALLNAQNGAYNLLMRGIQDGESKEEHALVRSVTRAINPYTAFDQYLSLAKKPDFRFVVSNTTEAGIAFDESCRFDDKPARSFPGKVTQLLYARFQANLPGFVFLPCELIDDNGGALRRCVLRYAQMWKLGEPFCEWVIRENKFCNTLVDRIVTGYPENAATLYPGDKLLDTSELHHLWVIEGNFEQELPLQKAGLHVIWTDDVSPYRQMKVRLLNGSHTVLVFPSMLCGVETVGDSLKDPQLKEYLSVCLWSYFLPMLGETEEARAFAGAVLERFSNPFICHLWKSISLNSVSKFSVRVLPTILDFYQANGVYPKPLVFSLACLIEYYRSHTPWDEEQVVACLREQTVAALLSNTSLWGADLSGLEPLVKECLDRLGADGIREALQWAIS